ncbi:hypothetical protein ACLKA7_002793 [Drosophila subpalustris]
MRRTLPDGIHLGGQTTDLKDLRYEYSRLDLVSILELVMLATPASIRNRTVGQRGPRASEPSAGNAVWLTALKPPLNDASGHDDSDVNIDADRDKVEEAAETSMIFALFQYLIDGVFGRILAAFKPTLCEILMHTLRAF